MAMSKERVLFVDDEANVLAALRRALRDRRDDWEMVFLQSAEEALEENRRLPFRVIVTDLKMPGMSGLDLVRVMRRSTPEIVPIVLTGAADLRTAVAAINETSVFRFYTKPCPPRELISGIEAALVRPPAVPEGRTGKGAGIGTAVLNRLPVGVIIVDARAHVVFMNRGGAEIIGRRDGLSMDAAGDCRAATADESARLRDLIAAVAEGDADVRGDAAMQVNRPSLRRPLSVVLSRLDEDGPAGELNPSGVMILVADPEMQLAPSAATIARLFGLTNAEAALARAMTEGKRLDEAAMEIGITLSSARTYLKRVFSKTGTGRQAELVRLLLTAPVTEDPDRE